MSVKNILCTMLALGLSVSAAYAAPSVNRSGSSVIVKESLTDEGLSQAREIAGSIKTPEFKLEGVKDADLPSSARPSPMPAASASRVASRASLLWQGSRT